MNDPVQLTTSDGIAALSIEGPIDQAWAGAFLARGRELHELRREVRVVTLAGRGRFFCPGGDLRQMRDGDDIGAEVHRLAATLHEGLLELRALPAPVIVRVHGAAAGAGMSLVLAADIAVGSPAATFRTAYAAVGLSPDGGMSWLLPRIVGTRRATELLLTGRTVSAEEGVALGLLTELVAEDALDGRVDELARQLAAGPTGAYGAITTLLDRGATLSLADQLDLEAETIGTRADSAEGREGIAAFAAKRRPAFA
jgi:2-(1,2-epoxy-1,2-dihydrophenyl)acetyl-CoA isomerase